MGKLGLRAAASHEAGGDSDVGTVMCVTGSARELLRHRTSPRETQAAEA